MSAADEMARVVAGERRWTVFEGDSLEVLPLLPECSVDAIVTDPPYGLGFMGREWDTFAPAAVAKQTARKRRKDTDPPPGYGHAESNGYVEYDRSLTGNQRYQAWCEAWARACFRVLKPGGHLVSFCGCRTYHRLASGVEDAGFEIRDKLIWLFGSGFPKSLNLHGEWEGWGSALKPAHEPIVLARKPLVGTITANVLAHRTGALNIAACRIESAGEVHVPQSDPAKRRGVVGTDLGISRADRDASQAAQRASIERLNTIGRWPPNVLLSEEAAEELDRQSGESSSPSGVTVRRTALGRMNDDGWQPNETVAQGYGDMGGASRFFPVFKYVAKAGRAEREFGLDSLAVQEVHRYGAGLGEGHDPDAPALNRNNHPTVKPVDVMLWLVRLVTPPGGVVLDPFTGSGTTGIAATRAGFRFIGAEREAEYAKIARTRIDNDMGPLFAGMEL